MSRSPKSKIRPLVQSLHAYVPGEQPRIRGLIKLNTNENPYPPSSAVLRATRAAVDQRLRLYPNPTSDPLREKLARFHRCSPENIVVGNGSDDILALAIRALVEPARKSVPISKSRVQYFHPSYSLYPVLAATHGAVAHPVPLNAHFELPSPNELRRSKRWDFDAALTFITTPNAPSGRGYSTSKLEQLCKAHRGIVILDEAYVDFAKENAFELFRNDPHVAISRTFSKAYSLCFQRVGYLVGHPDLVQALHKVKDSYNVNGLGQIAATQTLESLPHYQKNFRRIIATRWRLTQALTQFGFRVLPSDTNFLLCEPPGMSAEKWLSELRRRKILVRWFPAPEIQQYLRITIGTDREIDSLLRAVQSISKMRSPNN